MKVFLDIAKESPDWPPPLKSALSDVDVAFIVNCKVFVEWMAVVRDLHEHSQKFEDVEEKIEDLIPYLNRLKQNAKGRPSGEAATFTVVQICLRIVHVAELGY